MNTRINRDIYMCNCAHALCLIVAYMELVSAIPPEPIQKLSTSASEERYEDRRTESFSLMSANMETPASLENNTFTESFTETVGLSTLDEESGSNAKKVNFGLATGLGICALLITLLTIALALVLYQKHVERLEREEEKQNAGNNNPPPVPKRPDVDDHITNGDVNEYSHNPQRDLSTTSSNYIRPEPVRIAMVPRGGISPRMKSRKRDGGDEYYAVVQDSPSTSPGGRRRSADDEAAYYMRVLEDGERQERDPVNPEAENAYYIEVVEGGTQESPVEYVNGSVTNQTDDDRPPSPHLYGNTRKPSDSQTEQEPVEYVISAIGIAAGQTSETPIYGNTTDTPKRENSKNDYYSRVCISGEESGKNANDSLSGDKTQASDEDHDNEPVYSVSSNAKSNTETTVDVDKIKPKKKSAIYMNIRKYLKK